MRISAERFRRNVRAHVLVAQAERPFEHRYGGLRSAESVHDVDFDVRVRKVLEINLAERHIRGGEATRKKYLGAAAARDGVN